MFSKLKEMSNSLEVSDISKYVQVKNARAILQKIKVESQKLRQTLTEAFKASKNGKTISHKVTKEEVIDNNLEDVLEEGDEIKIPKEELVNENDDDFFDKQ